MTAGRQAVAGPPELPVRSIHHLEDVMGTVVTIDVYTTDAAAGEDASRQLATARAVLQRADAVFSTWKPHTAISRLRRGGDYVCSGSGGGCRSPRAMRRRTRAVRRMVRPVGYARGDRPHRIREGVGRAAGARRVPRERSSRRDRERGRGHRQLRRPGTRPALPDRHRRPLFAGPPGRGCLSHRGDRHVGYLRAR